MGGFPKEPPKARLSAARSGVADAFLSGGGAQTEALWWLASEVSAVLEPALPPRPVAPGCHPSVSVAVWVWGEAALP